MIQVANKPFDVSRLELACLLISWMFHPRYHGLMDSGGYLCISVFSFFMNLYLVKRFGEHMQILVSVMIWIIEAQLLFYGIGEAIKPIVSVYLAEGIKSGVKKIRRVATVTAVVEGIVLTVVMISASRLIPSLMGITDAFLKDCSATGICIMALGLVFSSLLYLYSALYLSMEKIRLGIVIALMRDLFFPLGLGIFFGMIGGIYGLFIGISAAPAFVFLLTMIYVRLNYGQQFSETHNDYMFEFRVLPEKIVEVRDSIGELLYQNGVSRLQQNRVMMLVEELFMTIYDKNERKPVFGECSIIISNEKILIITRCDGTEVDISREELGIESLRGYALSRLLETRMYKGRYQKVMSFNRNVFELKKFSE